MMNIDNLDSYILKFPTNYEYTLLRKCGISIKFPFIFCFPDMMETNLEQSSLWNKSILFLSMDQPCYSNATMTTQYFARIYKMPKLDMESVQNYNIYCLNCKFNKSNESSKVSNINMNNKLKLKIRNKIIKHYCELSLLCGELVKIDDVRKYILTFLF